MNVQNLKLQFSQPDNRPNNVVKTQIPVARFSLNSRHSSDSLLNGNSTPSTPSFLRNSNNHLNQPQSPAHNLKSPNAHYQSSNSNSSNNISHQSPSQGFKTVNSQFQTSPFKSPNSSSSPFLRSPTNNHFTYSTPQNNQTSPLRASSPDRWRSKFEDAERKRKTLLTQNQKLSREHEDLQRKYSLVQREVENTKQDLNDREAQLNQLRKLSEAVYKEYDQLKNQYELETGTMQQAMQKASQWYKQNRVLKRRSSALMQRIMQFSPETTPELIDDTDSGVSTDNDDFEDLRKTVQNLNKDVARLQAEINAARLQEFEAQETIVDLSSQLEDERNARSLLESELKELRSLRNNFDQVSRLVAVEVTSLREQCVREKETAQRMKEDADKAKKERNVLAHQSQLLMGEVADNDRLLQVLMEVEHLKRNLEEEEQRHRLELQTLQEQFEEREEEPQLELLEEKLKLTEGELQCALERADRADTFSQQLAFKVSKLEEELEKLKSAPAPPPPPMPPPPPPLPSLSLPAPVTLRRRPHCDGAETSPTQTHTSSAVLEMANLLGIPPRKSTLTPAVPGAIDDIINQIKGGRFTLKSTEPKPRLPKVDEQPPVVQEMINVLGTLRKRRTPSMRRQQEKPLSNSTL